MSGNIFILDEALLNLSKNDIDMKMNIDLANGLPVIDINRTEEFIDAVYDNLKYKILTNKLFNYLNVEFKTIISSGN